MQSRRYIYYYCWKHKNENKQKKIKFINKHDLSLPHSIRYSVYFRFDD